MNHTAYCLNCKRDYYFGNKVEADKLVPICPRCIPEPPECDGEIDYGEEENLATAEYGMHYDDLPNDIKENISLYLYHKAQNGHG